MRAFMLAALAAAIALTGCNKKQLRPGFCDTTSVCGGGLICDARDGGSWKCIEAGVMDAPTDATDGGDGGEVGDARDGGDGGDASDAAVDVPFRCLTSTQCVGRDGSAGNVCEPDAGACVECLSTNATACTGSKPVCMGTMCVQCLPNMADACTGTTPICVGTTCVRCSKDADCMGPGICMTDGHCAPDGEIVYVEFKETGCTAANGSLANPYCTPTEGVSALAANATKKVIVIRGAVNGPMVLASASATPLVLGRQNGLGEAGQIVTAVGTGITASAGEVLVRDLEVVGGGSGSSKGIVASGLSTKLKLVSVKVSLGMGLGVQADSGADLAMDRCTVENNSRGGILVDHASFDIRNTTVAGNGPGTLGAITWGGILISEPASGLNQLQLVTVQNNKAIGVSCSAAVSNMGVLASMNVTGDINQTCGFSSCGTAGASCGSQQ
jgi:hypothetical protein